MGQKQEANKAGGERTQDRGSASERAGMREWRRERREATAEQSESGRTGPPQAKNAVGNQIYSSWSSDLKISTEASVRGGRGGGSSEKRQQSGASQAEGDHRNRRMQLAIKFTLLVSAI